MPAIRQEGPIGQNSFLIDAERNGHTGIIAVFLLKSSDNKTCLIDAGTKDSGPVIYNRLQQLDAWPPDKIILTHSHWDHTQGVGFLCKKAAETGHTIDVMASEKALPYLADQSYNIWFTEDQAPFLNFTDVTGLKHNECIDLGSDLRLRIIDTPGHMLDHISVLDENNRTIFVGDALGMNFFDGFLVPNHSSEFWSETDFLSSIETYKTLDIEKIGMCHFGCLYGEEARFLSILSNQIFTDTCQRSCRLLSTKS